MRLKTMILAAGLACITSVGIAPRAAAYEYIWDCRGNVVWSSSNVTFQPSLVSFPTGSAWNASIEAMRSSWNLNAPGTNYRIQHTWSANANWATNDGRNSVVISAPADWVWGNALAVTLSRRSTCYIWPLSRADIVEADILFNPSPRTPWNTLTTWDTSLNPAPPHPQGPYNATLVGIHEHGHGLGLGHENDIMATMNAFYPNSGVIGNRNDVHPHADDVLGNRAGYGTAVTARDLAASAFRRTPNQPGESEPIPVPAGSDRNARVSFQFTVSNRGTTSQSSVPVRFYLSPDRNITTADFYLGATTLSLNAGVTSTLTANMLIPSTAPTGNQFLGWIIDPLNAVAESDEGNNAVGLTASTNIRTNRAPTACFTATPTYGTAPLSVSFNASCSSDPDGSALTYAWDFGDSSTGSGQTTNHWYWSEGYYSAQLTVTDPNGASASTWVDIYVTCSNGQELCLQPM